MIGPADTADLAGRAVAVLGHYGQLNLGDESLTAAVLTGLRSMRPDLRLIGISLNPSDTAERHGLPSFALRREISRTPITRPPAVTPTPVAHSHWVKQAARKVPGLWTVLRAIANLPHGLAALAAELGAWRTAWQALAGVQLVIVAGSNQLLDQMGGAFGFPYTLLKWSVIARLRGTRVVLISVGAGPLDGWLARRFVLFTLRLSRYVSLRDEGSARLVRSIGWRGPAPVLPDLAFGLDVGPMEERAAPKQGPFTVAVNLMPVHDPRYWPEAQAAVGLQYVGAMAAFVDRLLDLGHNVEIFGTQPADEWVAEDLVQRLTSARKDDALSIARIRSLDALARLYRRADFVAATRFHGILLALRFAKPVLGICYYRKSRELMRAFGLERYAFDLSSVSADQLTGAFEALAAERGDVERSIRSELPERAEALLRQYRTVMATGLAEAIRT